MRAMAVVGLGLLLASGCGAARSVWIVDRVEGRAAVLVNDWGEVKAVPFEQLPDGTAEGDALFDNRLDDEEPQWRRREIAERRARLAAGDDGADLTLEGLP
ncbi:MAG: DUF3006 domain-containing protein [Myxococcales bacterium]|jgi:hypothetical protein